MPLRAPAHLAAVRAASGQQPERAAHNNLATTSSDHIRQLNAQRALKWTSKKELLLRLFAYYKNERKKE